MPGSSSAGGTKAVSPKGCKELRPGQSQIDFEIEFFQRILRAYPEYVDVLRILGNNLTVQGRLREGLDVDRQLVRLRPEDYLAFYNLACTHALLGRVEEAILALRQSIELGYRDFKYMHQDRDLDSLRNDPRYRVLMAEYDGDELPPHARRG